MEAQKPTVGRIVHYKLTAEQADEISRRRVAKPWEPGWPPGSQAHVGNPVAEGDVVAMVVVRVWPDEFGPGVDGVNGQVLLDGNDSLWVTSGQEGTEPGQWQWPPRAA
jgi:hypothetical protein